MIRRAKQRTGNKKISHISQHTVFPSYFLWNSMIVWVWLGNIFQLPSPPALTSGVKVSQALPVCGFSQDPLPVGVSAPLLSPHQLRMLLLPSKSFLKPEQKKKRKRSVSMQGSLGVKKEMPLNAAVCMFDSISQTHCTLTRAYLWMWGW